MRVRDLAAWQERRAALTEDGAVGVEFLKFMEDWATLAEDWLDLGHGYTPIDALNGRLAQTEERHGRIDFWFMGSMLAVLAEHWIYGAEELMKSLTPVERRLVEDLTLLKVAVEQRKAETHGTDGEPGD